MKKNQMVEDIVELLDNSVAHDVGHLTIDVQNADSDELDKTVETREDMNCAKGNLACRIPNLDAGIDNES